MKIGICCHPTVGGSGVVATELARALAETGDEVHVMSYAVPPRWSWSGQRLFFHEVAVTQYPLFEYPPYSLALATKMVEVARQQGLDILHAHYAIPHAVSAILAKQMLAPQPVAVVTTLHGTDITLIGHDPSYIDAIRFGILRSDAVTAVSESLRQATVDKLEVDKQIEVVPNFVDASRYPEAVARRGGRRWGEDGERVLVHISNFRPVKRVTDVVHIFFRVCQELPCRLLLVGDGPELAIAERTARELGVRERVEFVGTVAEVEDVLASADLFLLPSETESFGLAALEALACEVPVVASSAGGLPEVVVDGETGFLLPVGDVEGMSRAALRLLRDQELRRRFGTAGRRDAQERFGREAAVEGYRKVYKRALDEMARRDSVASG